MPAPGGRDGAPQLVEVSGAVAPVCRTRLRPRPLALAPAVGLPGPAQPERLAQPDGRIRGSLRATRLSGGNAQSRQARDRDRTVRGGRLVPLRPGEAELP